MRSRSVFVSRAANVDLLSKVKEVVTAVADGEMDQATARWTLLETLRSLGYTPEGGFPDDLPGQVPPALRGTIQDLSSRRRLDLIIDTQRDLMRGLAEKARGSTQEELEQWPAWELVRIYERDEKRDWLSRWLIAGGKLYEGRMIALKGDPIWGELGSAGNFDDALDVDFPPFAFGSGMGWSGVSRSEASRMGIRSSTGETLEEWQAEARPVLGGLQEPVVSVRNVDPEILQAFEDETGVAFVDGQATTQEGREALLEKLAERKAARGKRRAELMERALAR